MILFKVNTMTSSTPYPQSILLGSFPFAPPPHTTLCTPPPPTTLCTPPPDAEHVTLQKRSLCKNMARGVCI